MTVVSTYWVGSGTLDNPWIVEFNSKGKSSIMILSGLSVGALLFVCGVQFVLAIVMLVLKLFFFAAAFFALGSAVAVVGYWLRGIKLCFEKKWLILSEQELVFKDGICWAKPDLRQVCHAVKQIPNFYGGVVPGWVIKFINHNDEEQHYQFESKADFKKYWACVTAWHAPEKDESKEISKQ